MAVRRKKVAVIHCNGRPTRKEGFEQVTVTGNCQEILTQYPEVLTYALMDASVEEAVWKRVGYTQCQSVKEELRRLMRKNVWDVGFVQKPAHSI